MGALKKGGGGWVQLLCFLPQTPPFVPPPSPPTSPCGLGLAVYLTVHLREGLTEVKAVGSSRGGIGRVSALCRRGTSLAGQCQAAPWGDETGPPRWTNAL